MDAWTAGWIAELEQRERNTAGGLWALAEQDKRCFGAASHEKEPSRLIHLHSSGFVTIPDGAYWVCTLHFYCCWQWCDPPHLIRDTGSLSSSCTRSQNRLSSSSTKSKEGRIGFLNWPVKSPHVSFYFTKCSTCIQQTLFHFCTLGIFKFKNSTTTNN